jgi:hypothetical protein
VVERLQHIRGLGHFTPLECRNELASALAAAVGVALPRPVYSSTWTINITRWR